MKVSEVVEYYHLELVNKTYKDMYGGVHNLVNLRKLADLEVRDFKLNLINNECTLVVIGIEKIDTNKEMNK